MKNRSIALLKLALSMAIFGSIGLFVRNIPLESSAIAFVRAAVGTVFLLIILTFGKKRISFDMLRKYGVTLLLSGCALGFNWILLFEAYKFTSVAQATLCYYMAPILVILASPPLLREKLTAKKLLCVLLAFCGMVFVSGVTNLRNQTLNVTGFLLGLGAAVLYAFVMLMNKCQQEIPTFERTIFQLAISAIVLLLYNLLIGGFQGTTMNGGQLILLLAVGVIHTGLAYYLYFSAMTHLPGQTIAIVSYSDPVIAVLISVIVLMEGVSWLEILGAVLIIGAAIFSELPSRKEKTL